LATSSQVCIQRDEPGLLDGERERTNYRFPLFVPDNRSPFQTVSMNVPSVFDRLRPVL